ncbi:hypothetical protein [Dethiothermospora halolimnae]|uniref:hypothetical protein n=1 Tax=Dethiothermospora halolimnae TaxID=3114390 RepID=UPI003CCBFBE9
MNLSVLDIKIIKEFRYNSFESYDDELVFYDTDRYVFFLFNQNINFDIGVIFFNPDTNYYDNQILNSEILESVKKETGFFSYAYPLTYLFDNYNSKWNVIIYRWPSKEIIKSFDIVIKKNKLYSKNKKLSDKTPNSSSVYIDKFI